MYSCKVNSSLREDELIKKFGDIGELRLRVGPLLVYLEELNYFVSSRPQEL